MNRKKDPKSQMEATVTASGSIKVDQSDECLVAAARQGDYSAFEQLYENYRLMVYRFVYQMTHVRDDAEDITQEVFLRAFQNLSRFRKQAKFSTWILRIATNLCTDRVRMHRRRTSLEEREASDGLEWMTVGKVSDPNQDLEEERRAELVRRTVSAMPPHHRSVLILRDFEQREYSDIAEILNCTVGGAKLRVLRARRALRDRLVPLLDEGNTK